MDDKTYKSLSYGWLVSHAIITSCILILFIPSIALGVSATDIKQIKNTIQNLQQDIREKQTSRLTLQDTLKQAEINLANLQQQHAKTTQRLKTQTLALQRLTKQENVLNTAIAQEQQQLLQQVRASYILGREHYLKILLNQENATQLSRNLKYYQYFIRYHLNLAQQLNTNLQKLEDTKQAVLRNNAQIVQLQSEQQEQIQQVNANQLMRQQSLSKINAAINTQQQHMAALLADKQALDNVIQHLDNENVTLEKTTIKIKNPQNSNKLSIPQANTNSNEQIIFATFEGKLSWPTQGKITLSFNAPIENSELKSNGVVISAPQGQKVYAIAPGKVIFAQWMSGYGLLLIIDHGQGYMTLYGRNGSIYKKVGDKVAKDEQIATVGESGGYSQSGLYFAIRKQGIPLNPSQWCHKT